MLVVEATRTPTAFARAIAGASSLRLAEGLPAQSQVMDFGACRPPVPAGHGAAGPRTPAVDGPLDDVDADTADIDVLVGLLETAPTDFARGIVFGKLTPRSQIAAVSGRPF